MTAVVSLGSVNADFLVRVPEPPAGSGALLGESLLRTSGGKAGNVAVLAARLGTPARLLGCVGDDDLAAQALRGPESARVNLRGVRRRRGLTGYSSILVPPGGAKTIVLVPNANDAWGDDGERVAAEVDAAPDGSVLVADLEVPVALVLAALQVARERGLTTVLDPAPPDRATDELLALADHLTPDHTEAQQLTGEDTAEAAGAARAAVELRKRGAAVVHVKLAGGGCVTATADGLTLVEAPADVPVVDATGAGDAFAGGLAVALVRGRSAVEAAEHAVAASTCAVGGYGSQESYPDAATLAAMLARVSSRPFTGRTV
jgi:ribokinase